MKNQQYIMAIDQGTTSTRAILFDDTGAKIATAQRELPQIFRESGWVEHDAMQIWEDAQRVMNEVVLNADIKPYQVAGIGITNQRETTVLWNRVTGEPIASAVVWQSKQSDKIANQLKADGLTDTIYQKTGLWVDSYFSATKIMWLLENVPGARELADQGKLLFGTIDTWLLWKMTNGAVHATDYSNASRTMLYNIHEKQWDAKLLEIFNIPASMLPEVRDSAGIFGYTADYNFYGLKVPIAGIAGDQQAALIGNQGFASGDVKNTFGTGSFIVMNTGNKPATSSNGLLTTIAYGINGEITYALEGSVFVAGAAVQWLRDGLEFIETADETSDLAYRALEQHPQTIYVVPALTGLGAPYWDQNVRGAMFGLTRVTTKADIVRATLESLAYQTKDVLLAMTDDTKLDMQNLLIDGGAAANDYLQQFQANLLQVPVTRPAQLETTALGVAYLAGLGIGFWTDLNSLPHETGKTTVQPAAALKPKMETQYENWLTAVKAARMFV
ncbi:MAG: glycerol kinase GlpK [Lactobacillaceae bacterium]|jgi:glycerol kinase|nr:glycerol kinase GlpK [Lactobacillaceae bacterium]